jgi:hypothetical protein
VKLPAIEQVVWSTTYRFAGTLDFLAQITLPGHAAPVYVVGDIKTGKAIYDDARLQVSAYVAALREMEHAPPGVWAAVVQLPKSETDPELEIRLVAPEEQVELFATFLHVQALWNWQQAQRPGRHETAPRRHAGLAGAGSGHRAPAPAVPDRHPSPPGVNGRTPGARARPADGASRELVSRRWVGAALAGPASLPAERGLGEEQRAREASCTSRVTERSPHGPLRGAHFSRGFHAPVTFGGCRAV